MRRKRSRRRGRRIPSFAMAYWGEALTHTHPLWRYRNREAGLKVLDALAPTPEARQAKAPTPREKAYLRAVDALYAETRSRGRAARLRTGDGARRARIPERR